MISKPATENLLAIAEAYAKATGLSLTTIGKEFYGKSRFFLDLRAGERSITLQNLDEVLKKFARKWPVGHPWPQMRPLYMSRPPRTML